MKTGIILPMSLNMFTACLFAIHIWITRRASFILVALVYVLMTGVLRADTHYVDANRPDDSGDGLSWATAEKTIQAAITAATAGDTIIVTNGIYAPISTANKAITIESVNGAAVTIIDGGGTNRCANLGSSSSHTNTVLVSFTLRNGNAYSGAGAYCGTLNNCMLTRNTASSAGGGSCYGTLNNCTLSGNSALSATGGGSYYSTLNNCTLSGNRASTGGGGSIAGTLNNCIVWGNTLFSGVTNNYWAGTFKYSCTTPMPSGTGNRSSDPLFRMSLVGDYRFSPGSPCLNAGTNSYVVGAVDGYGNPRIQDGIVDMGACEGAWPLATDAPHLVQNVSALGSTEGVVVSWTPPSAGGTVLYRVCRMDMATGQWMPISGWIAESSFLDTQLWGGVTYRYAIVSAFDERVDVISGLSATADGQRTLPQFYVDASRPDDSGDGRGWATAKKTIQAAIDISAPYDTILVTNGVYAPISTENKMIAINSVNGDAVTIIDGGGTNRCATLGSASTHTNTFLSGITLRNGYASSYGGGSCYGTLSNCTLTGNSAFSSGGGSYYGTLNNCTLSGNSALTSGGGAYYGTLNNCTLSGNSASSSGGGANSATLNNCMLTGNSASSGGGSYDGTLNNCTLTGNFASSGGGSYNGTLNNCICWGNTLASGVTNNYVGGAFIYSCTTPLPSDTANLSSAPMFRLPAAWDFRLLSGSPCLNMGINNYAFGAMDLLGNARIQDGRVDIGAYEGAGTLETDAPYLARNVSAIGGAQGVTVSWDPPSAGGAVLYRVCRMDMATGQWAPVSGWMPDVSFLDTQGFCGVTYRYAVVSAFDARLDVISGLSATADGQRTLPQFYVDASRPHDSGDGRSWATAKKSIQAAIALSVPYDTILVTNGVYAPISTTNKTIAIRSVNGAAVTVIDGGGTSRCATLGSVPIHLNTILAGFTLRNGSASFGGGSCYGTLDNCTLSANSASYGGGSYCGILNHCALSLNVASTCGGGSYSGLLNRCTLTLNRSNNGGGSYYGILNTCTLSDNSVSSSGGGVYSATLNNCALTGNSAFSLGGGAYSATLNTCTLSGNSASSGGGAYSATLNNCTLTGNSASSGGGIYAGTLNNCTLAGNWASSCGGSYNATLNNCISWGNTLASGVTNNYVGGTFSYSCTTPLPSGTGNISADPLFRLPVAGDFRLSPGAPCLNAGTNGYAVGSVDLLGNLRIQDGTVDMGAYEGAGTLSTDAPLLAQNVSAIGGADGVAISWDPPSAGGSVLYRVCRMDMATGQWAPVSGWMTDVSFLDTRGFYGVTYRYAVLSAFDERLDVISGLSATADGQRALPQLYVDAARPNDAGDGRSWATAKKTIRAAIGVSVPYDTILVTNGVYAPISTTNKTIAIRSVNGAAVTVIDGGGTSRCATLGSAPIHLNTILVGFTLRNGSASTGGGSCYGTLHNCMLSANSGSYGGGSYCGVLNHCTLSLNLASAYGGGSYSGLLNSCTLTLNRSSYGGGSYYGILNTCTLSGNIVNNEGAGAMKSTLNSCTLTGNRAWWGGGASYGTLNNCTLLGNSAYYGGGAYYGTLNNCTLSENSASYGGGSNSSTLTNCISWGNTLASGETNNSVGGTFSYSCTTPLPPGTGNICGDPLFRLPVAGDFRLSPGSPCLNTGTNSYAVGAVDVLGNARIQDATVDMGAYEGAGALLTDASHLACNLSVTGSVAGVSISWQPPSSGGAALYRVCRMDVATGQWTPISGWIAGTSFLDTQLRGGVTYRYAVVSAFDAGLDVISALSAPAEGQRALPQLYVDASRPDDSGDGRSWATAKKTIQAAINVSSTYDMIVVTNGVYASISAAEKSITIQSVNGVAVTIIDGGGTNRCATLGGVSSYISTTLVGFTLRNGYVSTDGGGSYYGTLNNCTLTGNRASSGGGSCNGTLNNCTLTGNIAYYNLGGGAEGGTLNNCTLTGNSAASSGGGSGYSTLNNCILMGNIAYYSGGGSDGATLNNCTLIGNSSPRGGGSYNGTLNNCIVLNNKLISGETNNYIGGTFSYSCTDPLPPGTGNICGDPLFRLPAAGDFRLSEVSPCLNAGTNSYAVGAVDFLGNARIQDGTVDMGAYEGAWALATNVSFFARNVSATGSVNGVTVSWDFPSDGGAILYRVCRMDVETGQWMPVSGWIAESSFLDTQLRAGATCRYSIVSAFDTRFDVISGQSTPAEGQRSMIPQLYVDASRPDDTGDGRSWATAKRTIQSAIALSVPYDTILVTNGVYAPISTTNRTIAIRSVNGAAVTAIDGGRTNRCATMGSASFHLNSILCGFTLRNGFASSGGGSCYGTLDNCTLSGNHASDGGGSYYGALNNCTLMGNIAASSGGGAYNGKLNSCTLSRNKAASYGGGAYYGTLNNCTLSGNSASSGGGSYDVTLNNCTLTANWASSGGGSCNGTLRNCISWGNTLASGETNNYVGGTFSYSCTMPLPSGTGNRSSDPVFRLPVAWDCRLSLGSPCLNMGTNGYAVGSIDLLGNPRIQDGVVDMGSCEGAGTLVTDEPHLARNVSAIGCADGVTVSWGSPLDGGAVLYRVCRMDMVTGQWTPVSGWIAESSFLDTNFKGGVTYRYAIVSAFDAGLNVISGLSAPADGQRSLPQLYVDASRPDDSGDGRSWQTAKRTIQSAIDVSVPYDMILVTNGVYTPISTSDKEITIQSVNGMAVTVIDAGRMLARCATLGSSSSHTNTVLVGFTLQNGNISTDGGGSYCGTLNNCMFYKNNAFFGGGSYYGILNNCTLTLNRATAYGGGAYNSTLNNCTLSGNSITYGRGGGSSGCTLNNCTLTGNNATFGGGGHGSTLNSCTLTGNTASDSGGGSYGCTLKNCIVWGNTLASGVTNNYDSGTFSYSCTTPLPPGMGNISNDPLFMDVVNRDLLLRLNSPCINAGSNAFVVGSTDVAGNPRIQNGTVDMGAYEMLSLAVTLDWQNGGDVTLTNVIYGQAYQLPPAVFADARFMGWWTLPNGMGACIMPETLVSVASNHMLYAQWDVNSVVGTTGLVWQTAGDSLWFVQTNAVAQGASAMRSGVISDDQTSWIGTSVKGPGHFSFWWRVSSEGGYDELAFAVDGVENRAISGTKKGEWQVVEVAFTNAGPHELRWTYSKDDSVSEGLDCGWLDRVAWIPAPPIIPGNPNVSSSFLDNVTQAQVDALVGGLRAGHPDVTEGEIAKKFEDAELFGFTGAALVGVGTDALARFNPTITLATLSVSEGDPRTLVVKMTIGNNIDLTPAEALSRLGEAINSRLLGVFKNSLSIGASEIILAPALSLDNATGIVTATFTLENPFATTGFLRMNLSR